MAATQQTLRIRHWLETIVTDGGVERLDDLHIDVIDEKWRDRSAWVGAAFIAFRLAVQLRDELSLPNRVVVAFSLKNGTGIWFKSTEELESAINWMPPSLYLLSPDHNLRTNCTVSPLPAELSAELPADSVSYLSKWSSEDEPEPNRTLYIER
jgi:hypothetical protein